VKKIFKERENGSTLFVALIISLVVGIILAGYMLVTSNRYQMTTRSRNWNAAIPVLEAGIEEALTHLQDDTDLSANGWTLGSFNGTAAYTKQRSFSDGSYYFTAITTNTTSPLIYSQGFVRTPYRSSRYMFRTVKLTTTRVPIVPPGINTINPININPTGPIVINSFSGSRYYPSNALGTAVIATDSGANPAITLNSKVTIDGAVDTGPTGTVSLNGAKVTSQASDMNQAYPVPTLPSTFTSPSMVTSGTYAYGGTNYTYKLANGNYQYSGSINIGVGKSMVVTGNATWYVNGSFTTGGTGFIYIAPGASLTLYVNGTTTISGGGIANGAGSVTNLTVNSLLTTETSNGVVISGNGDFVGTVNAPNADMVLSGNGNFIGGAIANSFTLTGASNLYLMGGGGGSGSLVVGSWTEI